MLLYRNHLLLTNEPVPAAEALGVTSYVLVIESHVLAHDLRCVAGNVDASEKAVLQLHASCSLGADCGPGASTLFTQ
jgi:hypothetical protein